MKIDFRTNDPAGGEIEIRPTICAICNVATHCGIDAHVRGGQVVRVEGSRGHPSSGGALCAKGAASRQYIYHPDRVKTPLIRTGEKGSGRFRPADWEEALELIAGRLQGFKDEFGPESVVFGVGYTKWMRPFLKRLALSFGSPNYITESSTCFTSSAMAFRLNYGELARPDLMNTRCLLVWSANPFHSKNPAAVKGLLKARELGMKIIEVGPLITPLTPLADVHLRMRPGTSGALALGLANVIIEEGLYDRDFVRKWTVGFDEYRALAREFTPRPPEHHRHRPGHHRGRGPFVCRDPPGVPHDQCLHHGPSYQRPSESAGHYGLDRTDRQLGRPGWEPDRCGDLGPRGGGRPDP